MPKSPPASPIVLTCLPDAEERAFVEKILARQGVEMRSETKLVGIIEHLDESIDAIMVAHEATGGEELNALVDSLKAQPGWSDLPVLVVVNRGSGDCDSPDLAGLVENTNFTCLERPLGGVSLRSTIQAALRARQRQRDMRDLLEQRDQVLASISDAFSALDKDWRYTYVNDKVAEFTGLPKEQIVGRVIWEIFPDAVGGEFFQRCHRARDKQQPEVFELFYEPWGRWLETRIYPTKEGVVIFRADMTERRKQEGRIAEGIAKLKESEDRLRLALEAADIGTFDFYPPTGELRWSNRCNELFGLPPDSKVDYSTYIGGIHPEDRHVITETVQGVLKPGSRGYYDIEYRTIGIHDGKQRWVSERGRAILDSSGHATRFIGTIVDITAAKTAALALHAAKKQAEEANRTKDQFLAMLSHELRTPLTPVLMTIAALRRDPQIGELFQRDLEVLQRNIELEASLIDDLLDLTRIVHGKFELHHEAVDIHAALDHALDISNTDLDKKKLEVIRNYKAVQHHSWADAGRLQQVFWNLVKNAVKFTPSGGKVEIRTRNEPGNRIVIEVADNGIGIDPELQPRIFDAFEQGGRAITSEYGGLGLGLAISQRVVDLHGGTIGVESEGRGRGSVFTIVLNAMETSLLDGPAYLLDFDTGAAGPAEILLVEDHEDTARVMRRVLETAGYRVGHAASVADARGLADSRKFDLLISDVGLPDGTGLDLMRHLRETQRLSGIALSGYGSDEDQAASIAAGFVEHLTKPVDWERLRDAIARILGSRNATGE